MPEGPYSPHRHVQRLGMFSWSPWGQPHHHLDVPVVNGDAADIGGRLPVGDALLVQLTAAQDEAWENLLSSRDCSPRSSGGILPTTLRQECSIWDPRELEAGCADFVPL